jgi:hypothetical protein
MLNNTHIWLSSYIKQCLKQKNGSVQIDPTHIMFCMADHFEPKWGRPDKSTEEKRINAWTEKYPQLVSRYKDSDDMHPRHTFFYPQEEYEHEHFEKLALLCQKGFGEIEVHLHHDNDTAEGLRNKIEGYKEKLLSHGLLSKDREGNIRYGFIHGNWALDNSRKDGKWCGVNNELEVLKETGCYADFTLPSYPSDTQTRKINSIYYAEDTPKPKSHNSGVDVEAGKLPSGDLMLIQGPLSLNWESRKFGILPRVENGEISLHNSPTPERIDLWVKQRIAVKDKPDWIFIKVYTHGAKDENLKGSFFKNLDFMFSYLEDRYNDGVSYKLHYVTAREMYNIIKAAEAGEGGKPGEYRDYILRKTIAEERKTIRVNRKAHTALQ